MPRRSVIARLAGFDLRSMRQVWNPLWSRPQRVHRLRHDQRLIKVQREVRY